MRRIQGKTGQAGSTIGTEVCAVSSSGLGEVGCLGEQDRIKEGATSQEGWSAPRYMSL